MNLDVPIRQVMTDEVQTIGLDDSLTDAWTLMLNGGFRHLPVVEDGVLVGMLSAADLLAEIKSLPDTLQTTGVVLDGRGVDELMTPAVITIEVDATVREACVHFAEGTYHAVPVVAGERLVGIFTTADLARYLLSA